MSEKRSNTSSGIGLTGALFILFVGLRLTNHIDWAWYWVGAPLWMPLALLLAIFVVCGAVWLLLAAWGGIGTLLERWTRGKDPR